jgi:hypothetical protein
MRSQLAMPLGPPAPGGNQAIHPPGTVFLEPTKQSRPPDAENPHRLNSLHSFFFNSGYHPPPQVVQGFIRQFPAIWITHDSYDEPVSKKFLIF